MMMMINPLAMTFQQKPAHKLHPKVKFSQDDDNKLRSIVEELGDTDWNKISERMGTRNARQCRERWENYLSPNVNKTPFTLQEDILLMEKYLELGAKWVQISRFFNNRTDISVKSRYMVMKRRNMTLEGLRQTAAKKEAERTNEVSAIEADHEERSQNIDKILAQMSEFVEQEESEMWGFANENSFWLSNSSTDF